MSTNEHRNRFILMLGCYKALLLLCIILCTVFFAGIVFSDDEKVSNPYYMIDNIDFETCSTHTNSSLYDTFFTLQTLPEMSLSSSRYSISTGIASFIGWSSLLSPIISAIDPASGFNIAPVHNAKIQGINFSGPVSVKLASSGEADIVATNIVIANSNELTCDLDLTGAHSGYWDVQVSREGDPISSLHNGFEIKSYSYAINIAINSPNPFDNTKERTTIAYRLEKDTDVNAYIFSTVGNLIWKDTYLAGVNGGRSGDNSFSWDGVSNFSEVLSNGVYLLHIVEKQTGRTLAKGKIMIIRGIR